MNKKIVKELIKSFSIDNIEMELLYQYVKKNRIDYSNSEIISTYLSTYTYIEDLTTLVNILNISTLKELEIYLEVLMPTSDRRFNGAFFTPSYIVDYIINDIKPKYNDRNIDPSCGCGAFLIGLAEYYKKTFNKQIKQTIKENIFGSDILQYNTKRTKLILSIYALQNGEVIEESDFNIICTDSLKHRWDCSFNNVVGNPPYVKFQDLSDETRAILSNSWTTTKQGAYNLYFAFFELGYKLLSDGKLGYITPNNYFTSLAAEPLRAFFERNKCIEKIVDFDSKKVFDVQTYTAITLLSKQNNKEILYDRIETNCTPSDYLRKLSFSTILLSELNKKKWRLLKSNERKNIFKIENIGEPIKNLYDICVGIATLKDAIFFVDGNTFDGKYYSKIGSDGNLYKIEKDIVKSVYKISDFKSQNELYDNQRKIICPYEINGTTKLLSEFELKSKYPLCYIYLESESHILKSRDKGKKTNQSFFAWGRTQGLSKFGVKLLTPTFSRTPRFLKVEEHDSYFTNGYGIFFKQISSNLFSYECNKLSLIENIDIVQKILNSSVMNYYITCTSVSIEGGYPCYQKNFIEKFSIPNFSIDEISTLRSLNNKQDIDKFIISKYDLEL